MNHTRQTSFNLLAHWLKAWESESRGIRVPARLYDEAEKSCARLASSTNSNAVGEAQRMGRETATMSRQGKIRG